MEEKEEVQAAPPEVLYERRAPWSVLNERDKGVIITHFLHGCSPSQIATLVKRSLPFVYATLETPEAQEAIAWFDDQQERGLVAVNDRLVRSRTALLDQLMEIALRGGKESNKLNATKHALALAGMVPIQKIASVSARVELKSEVIKCAMETIGWEDEGTVLEGAPVNGARNGGGVKKHESGDNELVSAIAAALRASDSGVPLIVDPGPSSGSESGLEGAVQEELLLPGEGGAWIRSNDKVPSPSLVQEASRPDTSQEADRVASGTLQEHDRDQNLSCLEADRRPTDPNPYYKRDSD